MVPCRITLCNALHALFALALCCPSALSAEDGLSGFDSGPGCTYEAACNYDPSAQVDDGSCDFNCLIPDNWCGTGTYLNPVTGLCTPVYEACHSDLDGSGAVDTQDLMAFLASFNQFCTE